MSGWTRFWQLSQEERSVLLNAAALLPFAHLLMKLIGYDRTHRLLEQRSDKDRRQSATLDAKRIAQLVRAAGYRGINPRNCLRESLTLWYLLRRRGFDPQLRIGVRKHQHALDAHAWVELAGEVLNDDADIGSRYAPLQEPSV